MEARFSASTVNGNDQGRKAHWSEPRVLADGSPATTQGKHIPETNTLKLRMVRKGGEVVKVALRWRGRGSALMLEGG